MSNAFMASAAKSKERQATIQRRQIEAKEEMVGINIRIPKSLHKKAALHRIETGESVSELIRRLLTEALG